MISKKKKSTIFVKHFTGRTAEEVTRKEGEWEIEVEREIKRGELVIQQLFSFHNPHGGFSAYEITVRYSVKK